MVEATTALALQAPQFAAYVEAYGPADLRRARPRRTHFAELARAICFQQLAGAAARTIHGRFEAALDGDVTPEAVLALPVETMRAAGLSVSTADDARDRAGALVGESVIRSESSVDAGVEASVEVGADLVMEVLLEQARR